MDAEGTRSAYRLALGITLIYILWLILPEALNFARFVGSSAPRSQAVNAAPRPQTLSPLPANKLRATSLESALIESKQFAPTSQLRCERTDQRWDYVCSYLPPQQPTTRLQFGVNVDAKRWVKVSGIVPVGSELPPPH
jgi:hypothetical protein